MQAPMTPRTWNTNIALIAGVAGGLIIGLYIGWVLWPVQWQGATLNELFPDAKAHYLSAVAEAYTMYDSPEAAATAQQRLAAFGDNLGQEIEGAIAYYSNSNEPEKEIRISNLTRLAQAVGVSTPNLVGLVQPAATLPAQEGAGAETANAPSEPAASTAGIGWLRWLFYMLLAILLVLGGVYLLLQASRRTQRTAGDDPMNEVIDERIGALNERRDAWIDRIRSYVSPTAVAREEQEEERPANAPWRPVVSAALAPHEQAEYGFEDDLDDPAGTRTVPDKPNPVQASHFSRMQLNDSDEVETDESRLDNLADEYDGEEDMAVDSSGLQTPYRAVNDKTGSAGADASSTVNSWGKRAESSVAPLAGNSLRNEPGGRVSGFSARNARYKLLEIYTAEYQMGMRDYDEAHGITDPQTSRYIGECGMGTSPKNGLLQNNPDHVVALDVWLFDKTDEKNMGSQTRVLLSEYAVDHKLEQAFLKERQDDPRPFTAQPNVQFDLESQNLLLKCVILEAVYAASGPAKGTFQSVKVEMHVHKKG